MHLSGDASVLQFLQHFRTSSKTPPSGGIIVYPPLVTLSGEFVFTCILSCRRGVTFQSFVLLYQHCVREKCDNVVICQHVKYLASYATVPYWLISVPLRMKSNPRPPVVYYAKILSFPVYSALSFYNNLLFSFKKLFFKFCVQLCFCLLDLRNTLQMSPLIMNCDSGKSILMGVFCKNELNFYTEIQRRNEAT